MAVDLSKQLLALQNSTDDLNALTDRANDVIRRAEIFLREKCRVGGGVNVPVESLTDDNADEGGPTFETYLGYDRYKGEFRIIVTHLIDGDPNDPKPWAECTRDTKLKSLEVLPELIGKLHEMVSSQLEDARVKIDHLDKMIPSVAELQQRPSASKKGS